ncbi:MAG: hypothetical protein IT350_02075 [Deltaproteobacteria bacterium]|nr:hypothetical protein [Deltaproteobacteria bacterium]
MLERMWVMLLAMAMLFAGCGDDDDDSASSGDDDVADDDVSDDDTDDDVSDDDATDDDADDDADDDVPPPPGCDTLTEGLNSIMVDGRPRSFYLDLPDGVAESWPWPVVFNWHGFGDTAANMRQLVQSFVNGPDYTFIGVTPEDSSMLLDWDIIDGAGPNNREVLLFDALIEEIDTCYGVDWDRVHSIGFSLGGAISDLLGTVRGDMIASIATYSGGYASNPLNAFPYAIANWPDLTTENKYVEMRVHGGVLDWMIMPFGQYGENDAPFLNERGHDYVECVHPYIHNMGTLFMGPDTLLRFLADHPYGTQQTVYDTGFPEGYQDTCVVNFAQ